MRATAKFKEDHLDSEEIPPAKAIDELGCYPPFGAYHIDMYIRLLYYIS